MKELLAYVVSNIVNQPEQVQIQEERGEDNFIRLKLSVAPQDMGQIIGKGGKIIRALRDLLRIKAVLSGQRVALELLEPQTQPQKENGT